jgi:cell division protein FtsA
MKKNTLYVLYIGTTKLVAMRGSVAEDGALTVERFVKAPAEGFLKGVVTNIEKASFQIRNVVQQLGNDFDYTKVDFHVIFSNDYLKNYVCNSSIYFGELMRPVTNTDIQRVIQQTKSVATIPLDEYIIDESPQSFIVNDLSGIIDPLELEARRLGVNLILFTVNGTVIRNIMRALEHIDIITDSFIPKAFASSFAVLRHEERCDGIVMIDIGGYCTDVIYVKNTILQFYKTIPAGGEDISIFLSQNLNITQTEARRLKERFGSAMLLSSFEDEIIPVVDIFGKTRLSLNKKRLYDQIFMSTKILLEQIKPVVDTIRRDVGIVSGIVLTGGGASLEGILEMSQDILGAPVRLGVSRKINGPKEVVSSPQFTAAAGLLGYVVDKIKKDEQRFSNKWILTKKLMQAKEWIQEYF